MGFPATQFEAVTLVFLNIAAFMVDVGETSIEVIGWICVVMVLLAISFIPVVLIYAACKRFGQHWQGRGVRLRIGWGRQLGSPCSYHVVPLQTRGSPLNLDPHVHSKCSTTASAARLAR